MRFPDALVANVLGYDGERGKSWLQDLPRLVAAGCRRWRLEEPRPLAELSFNYLVAGRRRDGRAVAKFMVERSALICETAWLRAQQGRGAVRLLDVAEDIGAYLMAEVSPAQRVGVLDERAATETIATQIANLSGLAAPDSLPSIKTWFAELPALAQQRLAGIDQAAIHRSAAIASALMVAPYDERLLHGDLHHDNVLSANDGWCVIDPKGVTGDPAHECAAMLRNGLEGSRSNDLPTTLRERVRILADLTAFDPARIAGWGYAQTVLSCYWCAQAGLNRDIERGLAVADALLPLIS